MGLCGSGRCNCGIIAGTGIVVTGSGTATDPYVLTASAPFVVPINAQTASYVAALTDMGKLVRITTAGASTFTIPTTAAVNFPIGSTIDVVQWGAGQVTLTPAGGVTLRSSNGLKLRTQYSPATLVKISNTGSGEWLVAGDTVV